MSLDYDTPDLYPFRLPTPGDPDFGIDWERTETRCKQLGLDLLSIREGRVTLLRPDGVAGVIVADVVFGPTAWLGPTIERCYQYPPEVGYDLGRVDIPRGDVCRPSIQDGVEHLLGVIAAWRPRGLPLDVLR